MSTNVSTTETNPSLVREYGDCVFKVQQAELAAEYMTPNNVKWHEEALGTIEGRGV